MKRALIVDDNTENRYLLRASLEGHGWQVDEAAHGAEGLVRARQHPPDLVISDLLMPVMDGYTLLRHWKADDRLSGIPFVVYTATYTDPKDERLALDLGADAFIVKPSEPEPFMKEIHRVLANHNAGRLSPPAVPENDEENLLQRYNEALVRKLEKKIRELEQSNHELEANIEERQQAEAQLKEQLKELRRWHELMVGREIRMLELKREVNELLAKLGQAPRYRLSEPDAGGEPAGTPENGPEQSGTSPH